MRWPSPVTKKPLPVPTAAAAGQARPDSRHRAKSARTTAGSVVRPAAARSRVLDATGRVVVLRLFLQLLELVELAQQRLQADLGGRVAVGLPGQILYHTGRAFEIAPGLDRPRAVSFLSLHPSPSFFVTTSLRHRITASLDAEN